MFAHIMPFRNINLRLLDLLCRTQFYFFLEYDYLISVSLVTNDICMKCNVY